jgi:large subunit ribosomal protein L4e
MKTKLLDSVGKEKKVIEMPKEFSSKIRPDLLQKVVECEKQIHPYGSKPGAGAQYSASGILIKRRKVWKATYGRGISRVPRKIMSRSGTQFNWIGATVASARGGRRAHPPKALENRFRKVNKKEFIIALNSAFAGTISSKALSKKYNKEITQDMAIVFDSSVLTIKTKEFFSLIKSIFGELYSNAIQKKKIRAGRGKMRGRKYKKSPGLLFIISSKEKMNRKGIEVVTVKDLTIGNLAPNGVAGRITAYTENAIKEIEEMLKEKKK